MKKNILLVLLDGCRADRLGCYGYTKRQTTPNIDREAEKGLVALNNYATSFCTMPSVVSMMTGLYPCLHRATATWGYYDGKYPFLTDILRKQGYQTFGISNNIAAMSPEWGFIRGYDRYYRVGKPSNWFKESQQEKRKVKKAPLSTTIKRQAFDTIKKISPILSNKILKRAQLNYYHHNDMGGRKAVEALELDLKNRDASKPFFGYINLPDTHAPYFVPKPFIDAFGQIPITDNLLLGILNPSYFYKQNLSLTEPEIESLGQLYDCCVHYTDYLVGKIIEMLKKYNLYDNTSIVFAADHGGMIGDRENYIGGFCFTYNDEIKVPLIITNCGTQKELDILTSCMDIFPSALEMADINLGDYSYTHGNSIFSSNAGHDYILADYPQTPDWLISLNELNSRFVLKHIHLNRTMITSSGEKLIWVNNGKHHYYQLNNDPLETKNIFSEDNGLDLIESMRDTYEKLLGPKGRHLEIYDHNDVGFEQSKLQSLDIINSDFDPSSIILLNGNQ